MSDVRCPDTRKVRELVYGRLAESEVEAIRAHLRSCTACRLGKQGWYAWPASLACLALLIAGIAAVVLWRRADVRKRPLRILIEASHDVSRNVEPRLTGGFPWTPFAKDPETRNHARYRVMKAAATTIRFYRDQASPETLHAAAIAHLLAGQTDSGAGLLQDLAATRRDAPAHSDLSATQYVLAVQSGELSQLMPALASVDRALEIDASLPEARFNRALIVERLGLRDCAREAWEHYLAVDATDGWAAEAREHVRNLQPTAVFEDELACLYDHLMDEPAAARLLAQQYRQDARNWGETEILSRWAAAARDGSNSAAGHLAVAREMGASLAADRGDGMLQALVAAIDGATGEARTALIEAHLAYAEGRDTYGRQNQPARARPIFLRAEQAFRRGGSPGERLARYFAANTLHPLGRSETSRQTLEQLIDSCPASFTSHRAQVLWQLGLVHYAQSRWGEAIAALNESVELFDRLDERRYAASIREILANAHDRIGDRKTSWIQRIRALQEFGQRPSPRLLTTLTYLSRSAVKNGDWPTAMSLLALSMEVSRRVEDKPTQVAMHLQRARLHIRMGNTAAARADLLDARTTIQGVSDPGYQSLFAVNATAVEALLTDDPVKAGQLLTPAVEFHSSRGVRAMLPELLLERGRAHLRANDQTRAAADFEAGIAELESNRETLPRKDDRVGVFRDGEDLFGEAMELALAGGNTERAFQYVQRARARALLDTLGTRWPSALEADIPRGTVLLEYFLGGSRIAIFVLDQRGIHVVQMDIDAQALLAMAKDFSTAARSSDRRRLVESGRRLHQVLMQPVRKHLAGHRIVVIVPDPKLDDVPFAALVDDGRFLIERHPIVISPSAAVYMRLLHGPPPMRDPKLLVVAGAVQSLEPLAATQREVEAVARSYDMVTSLSPAEATTEAVTNVASSADVVHFAGHAVESSAFANNAHLVLTPTSSDDGRLDLKEIAALPLDDASLVVLAACSTSSGETISTEGTLSPGRAFLAAGARSVISTLWPVDDEAAAQFFPAVHRHLSHGLTPAEALRAAQLEWIRNPKASLSVWTGVQLLGTEGPVLGR